MIGGLLLAIVISVINGTTWDYVAYYGLPESARNVNLVGVIFFAGLVLVLLAIGLLAFWRRRLSQLKES